LTTPSRIEELEREVAALRDRLASVVPSAEAGEAATINRLLGDRRVLENLPDIITISDRDHRIAYLNRSVTSRRVEDVIGTNALDYVPPDQRQIYCESYDWAWASGASQQLQVRSISDIHWQTTFLPVKENGRVVLIIGTSKDITEQKRAEIALRESESRLRLALEATGMGTWEWNRLSGEIIWDAALCKILGLEPAEAPRDFAEYLAFVHPDDSERVGTAMQQAVAAEGLDDLEHRVIRRDGEVRTLLSKGAPWRDEAGVTIGFRGGVLDISERKRLEEQLQQVQKMEAVGRLTAGIAHNFNNMLSVILPNVSLCRMELRDDSALDGRLADVQLAANQAAEMVRQLMLFARSGLLAPKLPIDPVAVARRTLEICRNTFERKIGVELDAGPDVPWVTFAPGQLDQVLLNICLNARDALEDAHTSAPKITLHIERGARGQVRIRIGDNGPGMDEATRLRAFEPFFTTKEIGRGTGLGLSSAYAIVSEHGGEIRCQSRLGYGTSFELDLPASAHASVAQPRGEQPRPEPQAAGTLLLVDDEPLVRRALRALLERAGYRVIECDGGGAALAAVDREGVALAAILLDRSMPGLSGDEVLARLSAARCEVPVVLLSGQLGSDEAHALAAAVLSKPVETSLLLKTLNSVIVTRKR
jgi:PAS domain S-box-containing protein